jgi:4-hydroxybenzoate polyprenyltransferase
VKWSDALVLGRVSNLPTVWTNALAGVILAGGSVGDPRVAVLLVAFSLCYVAGMFLNDAFDREFDRRHRSGRPIPAGRVTPAAVFGAGFAMLGAGVALLGWVGFAFEGGTGWRPLAGGLALAAAIVFYDLHHKGNPLSPLVMGFCRALVYLTAGYAIVESPPAALVVASLLLLSYLIGLTYVAKQEHLGRIGNLWPLAFIALPIGWGAVEASQGGAVAAAWLLFVAWTVRSLWFLKRRGPGDVPRAVGSLLAGICLWDALVIAAAGQSAVALLASMLFLLTLVLQRYVAPT